MNSFVKALRICTLCCASALPLLAGCGGAPPRQEAARPTGAAQAPARTAAPEVHVVVDEAMRQRPHAVLGGSVENIGGERLEDVSVELELRRREDGAVEVRRIPVKPATLAPGEKGRYSLKILSEEWSSSRLLRVRSGARGTDVAFKFSPGARRPPEKLPDSRTATASRPAPRPRPAGEEFINTPETAISVP